CGLDLLYLSFKLSPYNLFCWDILKNKGEKQYLMDIFQKVFAKYFTDLSCIHQCKTAVSIEKNHQVIYCKRYLVFALHFKASSSAATPTTKDPITVLLKKVQDLFNQRYSKLPYQSLVNKVAGLPTGLDIKKPSFYGRNQLEAILAAAEQISFEISKKMLLCFLLCSFGAQQMEGESSETATTVAMVMTADEDGGNLCCVCRIHFDDKKKKNATKKWRSWSQCSVGQSWSHTACGFKRTMCLHCQGQHTMQTA
uniref:Zgc:113176 n=1 Tax=Sander lucioperca TaxID=283035 RepID=A0A8C9YKG0_SANLU